MLEKQNEQSHNSKFESLEATAQLVPKYPQPKILLLDMQEETKTLLKAAGYQITVGSFGVPYKVAQCDDLAPVITNDDLPWNFAEQEIVVIDLLPNTIADKPIGEKRTSPGSHDWWASCNQGVIDPRPCSMATEQESFDRILSHGGVFIVFASARMSQELALGYIKYRSFVKERDISYNNWSFLSILDSVIHTNFDSGQEISVVVEDPTFNKLLAEHTKEAKFICTLNPPYQKEKFWFTIAEDKYGSPVSAAILPPDAKKGGIFIFPRLNDEPHFLIRFFNEVLPNLCPHLFTYAEGSCWVQQPEYEIPKILELQNEIEIIQEETSKEIAILQKGIEAERAARNYLHSLIKDTGNPLVVAVKKTLEILGFHSVINVDEEMKSCDNTGFKNEDLRIEDDSPVLLVEVKGISGLPKDAAALQVGKYIAPRMRQWNRTDIQGLAIINHQRNLPGLDRDNKAPFREDILTNAQEQDFGLLTTWDLFRLVRSYLNNGWQHEQVKTLFYQSGQIEPVPIHYEFVGIVEHFWEKAEAIGVQIEAAELKQGDRIAFELPIEFEEQNVESLQVDKQQREKAEIGMLAGIKTKFTKERVKKGVRVFRLKTT